MGEPATAAPLEAISTRLPRASGRRIASCIQWKPAFTSLFQGALKPSQLCSCSGPIGGFAPALSTSTVGRNSCSRDTASARSVTSPTAPTTPSRCSTSASRCASRATTMILAPRAARASTTPRPRPLLPPVTITRWFFRFCM
jgi:hypothetical protein